MNKMETTTTTKKRKLLSLQPKRISISKQLYELMKNHVGKENGVTSDYLLSKTYGLNHSYWENKFNLHFRIYPALKYMRKHTRCFVVGQGQKGQEVFFVLKTQNELDQYTERQIQRKRGIDKMIERAKQSVQNKWYEEL